MSLLVQLGKTLKNPLVIVSLMLGIVGAPPLWFSGILLGAGKEMLAGLLFGVYVLIYSADAVVTLTLLINRPEGRHQ